MEDQQIQKAPMRQIGYTSKLTRYSMNLDGDHDGIFKTTVEKTVNWYRSTELGGASEELSR